MKDNLREPDFSLEEDMFVMVTDQRPETDRIEGLTLHANVLIFSYNRPRMVREAIDSVLSQDYENFDLYIVDDGSDNFEPQDLLDEYKDSRLIISQAERIPMEERLARSRLGENANFVIQSIEDEQEPVYYLCDDDLMASKWLSRSIRAFQQSPDTHIVQGESWYFEDGQDLSEAIYGMPLDKHGGIPTMFWSTGSFAHRVFCSKSEGIWWSDNTYLHSQDTNFIMDFWKSHSNYGVIPSPAVYRREHENTLSAKLGRKNSSGKYEVGFVPGKATEGMLDSLED